MIDFNRYSSLSVNAQIALCSMAYLYYNNASYGSYSVTESELKSRLSKLGLSMSVVSEELVNSGMVVVHMGHIFTKTVCYSIKIEELLGVQLFLYSERRAWVRDFSKFDRSRGAVDDIRNLLCRYVDGKPLPQINFLWRMEAYSWMFIPHITDTTLLPLFCSLYSEMFRYIVRNAVVRSFREDTPFDYDGLMAVIEEHPSIGNAVREELFAIAGMYRFFYDGTYNAQHLSKNPYMHYLVDAIRCMNKGDNSKAVQLFAEALKKRNKISDVKNVFSNTVANYYLLMAYFLDNTPQSNMKLLQFGNKGEFLDRNYMRTSHFLSKALADVHKEKSFKEYFYGDLSKSELHFAYLFAEYWEMSSYLKKIEKPYSPPVYKILRHELSAYLNLTDSEREELKLLYGEKPVLSSIYRKQRWETVFDNIDSGISDSGEIKKEESNIRMAYIIGLRGDVEVREQQKLKNGKWGAGKKISAVMYESGNLPYMNETDLKILGLYKRKHYLQIEDVVPFMVDDQRLFYGQFAPFEPVKVTTEHLYFEVKKNKKSFVIESNVSSKDLSSATRGVLVRKLSNTEYCVININREYLPLYGQILSLKSVPLEAESRMPSFLKKLSSIVEVHSEMLEGGSSLECVEGSPIISVQIGASAADVYKISPKVRPLAGGERQFAPGEGQTMVSDTANGVRYRVRRSISEEEQNIKAFSDFVENEVDILSGVVGAEFETTTAGLLSIMNFVHENPEICLLEWDSDKKLKLKKAVNPSDWNITMKSKNSWFEIEGDVNLDDNTILTVAQLLQFLGSSKGNFVKISDDEYVMLNSSLRKQLSRLEAVSTLERGKMRVSHFGAATLGDDALKGSFVVKSDSKLNKLRKSIKESAEKEFSIPKTLQATLRDYQVDGFQWMARMDSWGAGICLADDMGLGKTVQTIAFLLHKVAEGASLVVAPVSVVPNWKRELERFAPSLNVVVLNSADDRATAIKEAAAGAVVLSSYGMLLSGDAIVEKEWNVVVLDEAHAIKNRDTKTSAVTMKLNCKSRMILTGTPIQNNLGELWNLFQFVNPGLLGGWEVFKRKYMQPIEEEKDKERQKQLKRLVQPFMLRRTKADVLDDLPEKNEIILPVELTDEELSVYEFIRRRAENMLKEGGNKIEVQTLAEITRLRQAACCASLVKKEWTGSCAKIDLLMSTLENITTGGNRTLLFSQFTSFLEIVKKRLDEAGIEYLYLDGGTTIKQREKLVQRFQQGETSLFIISLKAGGLGLNLTGANYVVHLDPWWNPAIEQQATDRAYRIGQQQNVTVYHLVSKNTIEEKILRLHQSKRNMADALLEGSDVSNKLTAAQLLDMIGD